MIRSFPPLLRSIWVMNACALLLLGVAMLWPLPGEGARSLPSTLADLENPIATHAMQDVSGILERPLFHENRRKPVKVAAAPVPRPVQRNLVPPFNLVGVLGTQKAGRTAYLFSKQTQETISAKVGQQVGDWRVEEIGDDTIVLETAGTRQTLQMTNGG